MLILASQSETRKSLLAAAGLRFEAHAAHLAERAVENTAAAEGATPAEIARRLAVAKAMLIAAKFPDAIVIGADQILAVGQTRLHKPEDFGQARVQLDRLRGRAHQLYTGAAIVLGGEAVWSEVATATLTMRDFADAERDTILAQEGAAVFQSVGGYRLEGPAIRLFEAIEGDYFSILGLPLLPLLSALRRFAPHLFTEPAA